MPRPRSCTYYDCKQSLLAHQVDLKLNKTQLRHVQSYHRDTPVHITCPHTKEKNTFRRSADKDMNYVCLCTATFPQNNNFHRHFKACKVVNKAAGAQLASTSKNDYTSSSATQNSTIDVIQSHGELAQNTNLKGSKVPSLRCPRSHNNTHPYRRENSLQGSASDRDHEDLNIGGAPDLFKNHLLVVSEQFQQLVTMSTEQQQAINDITTQQRNIQELLKSSAERHEQMAKWMTKTTSSQEELLHLVHAGMSSQQNFLQHSTKAITEATGALAEAASLFTKSTATQQTAAVGLLTKQHKRQLDSLSEQHAHNLTALTDQHRDYLDKFTKNKEALQATLKEHNSALNADLQPSLSYIDIKMETVTTKIENVFTPMDGFTTHQ